MKGYLAWIAIIAAAFGLLGVAAFQSSASGSKPAPKCNPHNCPTTTTTTMPTTTTTICPTALETSVGRHVRLIAAMLAPAAFVAVAAATCGPPPPPPCNGPTSITTGGTYTGCWASTDSTPAVTITTNQPVTITNSTVSGGDQRVYSDVSGSDITITHTRFNYTTPPAGAANTYAVILDNFKRADLEHNTVDREAGFFFTHTTTGASDPLTVRYNQFTNMSGDITGGGRWNAQAIQLNNVHVPNVDISWNEVDNTPNQSDVEDNISIYQSSGTSTSPINVHDNYVNGGYPNPATASAYTGGGIMLGDGGGNYETAQNNIVIRTTNYGFAQPQGTNLTDRNNIGVSACALPDGTPLPACDIGTYVWPMPTGANDQAYGNTLGWWKGSFRNDWWIPGCTGNCSNTSYGNPSAQITLSDESAQTTVWQNKLAANGVTIGA